MLFLNKTGREIISWASMSGAVLNERVSKRFAVGSRRVCYALRMTVVLNLRRMILETNCVRVYVFVYIEGLS